MRLYKRALLIGLAGLVLWSIVRITVNGFFPIPIGLRHLGHLAFPPSDLFQPIVTDTFSLSEAGVSKTYALHPKHLDVYEIGFVSERQDIPSTYRFTGRIKVEWFHRGTLVSEQMITSIATKWDMSKDLGRYRGMGLLTFEMPLHGKHRHDVSVRLTVVEPDPHLSQLGPALKLVIAVSGTP